jgi:pimeloyl-ACP methyl ester carboxylesterase
VLKSIVFSCCLFIISFSVSACPSVSGWHEASITDADGKSRSLFAYQRWLPYLPGMYLDPQVIFLTGGTGSVECDASYYEDIASKASYNGRQAIIIDLDYWKQDDSIPDRTTLEETAAYVVATLEKLVDEGYLRPSFYIMGQSAGAAVISAALDYHPSFVERVERAIFVSGPFTDIHRQEVTEPTIMGMMDSNDIKQLDSLDYSLSYSADRYKQWVEPIMAKNGFRIYVAEDDNVACEHEREYYCETGNMYEEFINWLSIATAGTLSRESLENTGILRVYPQGGHNLLLTHTELLNDAFSW